MPELPTFRQRILEGLFVGIIVTVVGGLVVRRITRTELPVLTNREIKQQPASSPTPIGTSQSSSSSELHQEVHESVSPVFEAKQEAVSAPAPRGTNAANNPQWVQAFEKAALSGDVVAMKCLGHLYTWGVDVPIDYQKARPWYERAAAVGDAEAMFDLGYIYDNGLGTVKDYRQARQWYQRAAALDLMEAKDRLRGLKHIPFVSNNCVAERVRYWEHRIP